MRITESKKITDFFGCYVFNDSVMKKYLTEDAYNELKEVIDRDKVLEKELANKVAEAMKEWSTENGATHYTHWFQPLTGTTAEKHDSFISVGKNGEITLEFTGSNLRKGEADASSFPSGGIRATFEARGYTAWDCSSPAFIKKSKDGAAVLCIPTAFCSYTGEALDKKTPLLKSMDAVSRQGVRLLRILGVDARKVIANVGGEQEYFLIDKNDYDKRYDLEFTGRTLFGAMPPKGQEKNDQYYATIRDRVSSFMAELNEELWKLGITAKTQHNEVAPAQHELAPIFCQANIATDQNQLIMETMKKVADSHGLACLLHEKPFAGINGSGKHANYSLGTDTGLNLLKPGSNPAENKVFLLFFLAVIAGVDEYYDLLRMSCSSLGNDCRLGGHEAPPSIISVFIGEDMKSLLDDIVEGHTIASATKQYINMGVNYVARPKRDTSDRNRTSPFAFTGNKFEFRMVGSSATLSTPTMVMNIMTAEMLSRIADRLEKADKNDLDKEILATVKDLYTQHSRIIFNGNNYSKDWAREAKRRGLDSADNAVDAYEALNDKKNMVVFQKHGILSIKEMESRRAIYIDNYVKSANIEAETALMMTRRQILPAVMKWQYKLAKQVDELSEIDEAYAKTSKRMLAGISALIDKLDDAAEELQTAKDGALMAADPRKQAILFRDRVLPVMNGLREIADKLETRVPKEIWPFPTYADILFYE